MDLKQILIDSLPKIEGVDLISLIMETQDSAMGDLCIPCFSLAKVFKKSPALIAENLVGEIKKNEYIEKAEALNGYLNFYFNKSKIGEEIIGEILDGGEAYFNSSIAKGKVLCLDYSSVNLAKYMHIGHLKTTIIGESLARMAEALGYKAVRINYIGDYGTPFGKIIAGILLWGDEKDIENRGIDALQDLYVKFTQEAENDDSLNELARNYFKKIEDKDPTIYPMYQKVIAIGLNEAKRLLNILDVKFDSWRGESYYADRINDAVELLKSKNLLTQSEGATVVDLSKYDMPPCLIKKTDGASTYATRDILACIDRYDNYKFDKMFYVTSHEQMLHFKQFFKVLELAGEPCWDKLEHIHYGLFTLPTGKISSRKGKQATLVDLLDYAKNKAGQVIEGRSFSIEKPEDVINKVARGALNFSALKVEVGKDCVFDIDKAFSFEGETAPYMQYSYTRIESILRRVGELKEIAPDYSCLNSLEAFELIKEINSIKSTIALSFNKREPSMLTKKCMDICKTLNKFYTTTKVLGGSDGEILAKVNLLKIVKEGLKKLFHLICIDTLKEM